MNVPLAVVPKATQSGRRQIRNSGQVPTPVCGRREKRPLRFGIAAGYSNPTTALAALALMAWCWPAFADWPQFRGPTGQGISHATDLSLRWSETENVAWKVPVPGQGYSSPVIGGSQIWMTTASDEGRSLRAICFDPGSGKLIHNVELVRRSNPGPVHSRNSHATPTPVWEDDRIYIHFGAAGTFCLDGRGRVVWKQDSLAYRQPYSGGSSPVLAGNLLILTCDGTDVQFIAALDKRDGHVAWKTDRKHLEQTRLKVEKMTGKREGYALMAYSTPLVIEVNLKKQLVSTGADCAAAYDVETGEEIWWCVYDGFSEVTRPVYSHGIVFLTAFESQTTPVLYAIRPNARGEVTRSDLVWRIDRSVSHVPSPLLVRDELYFISDKGVASCVDARSGKLHWRQRIGGNYSASLLLADQRIYAFSEEGKTVVWKPGTRFRHLAENQLDGRFMASPAVKEKALYLRSDTHLYRIEKKYFSD